MKRKYLESGKILGTHGLRGDLRLEPWCDSPEFLCGFKKLYLDPDGKIGINAKLRAHKNIVLCKFEGVDSVEQAEKLKNKLVYIDRDDVRLGEGVNFIQDLLGCKVIDADDGRLYGELTDVFQTGANDVYEITSPEGKKYLAPAIDGVIIKADTDAGRVTIRPMKGIFDDED